ncbi:fringe glycosyltransferase [Coccinella septempunctata]|uniref:fringe glycosyltransferase n=1 Tax=Coccinella septempunctata TaxID=41139 RepID=UPI001D079A5A|nr:fringe glycosyltransferase [Coccinella septempunctata]
MSRDGEQVIFIVENDKMHFRNRKLLQTLTVAVLLAYTILLVYQSFSTGVISHENIELHPNDEKIKSFRQRLQRHLSRDQLGDSDHLQNLENPATISPNLSPGEVTQVTMRPFTTSLNDLFISVKTTKHFHKERLPIILKTWFQLAKDVTWFFTDTNDEEFHKMTNGHMINTNCSSSHSRKALCCKMSVEFDTFIETDKKWFCHFDDDNYVNIPRLVDFLSDYNPREDWYLGKPSIQAPLEIINKDKSSQKVKFWFATGGAGFCLSKALALKMMPVASGGKFISTGEKIRLPDDVTMGYIIEHLLKKPLTVVDQFHSHLEPMKFIRRDMLKDQISFSYSKNKEEWNVVKIEGFDAKYDTNRFLSLHCFLFPETRFCPR